MNIRSLLVFTLAAGFVTGCDYRTTLSTVAPAPDEVAPAPAEPAIEVTAVAEAELMRRVRELRLASGWQVRLTVKPGGCTGFKNMLDLDTDPPQAADATTRAGRVTCVYTRDQFPLVQGALIDYRSTDGESGFLVTYPKKTAENQALTTQWLNAELAKFGGRVEPAPPADRPPG